MGFLRDIIGGGKKTFDPKTVFAGEKIAEIRCNDGIMLQLYAQDSSKHIKEDFQLYRENEDKTKDAPEKPPKMIHVMKVDDALFVRRYHMFMKFPNEATRERHLKNAVTQPSDTQADGTLLVGNIPGSIRDHDGYGDHFTIALLSKLIDNLKAVDITFSVDKLAQTIGEDMERADQNWMPKGMDLSR